MSLKSYRYSTWQKFIHKHGYHYAPRQHPPQPYDTKYGLDGKPVIQWFHWCQWCGLRGTTIIQPKETKADE